MQNAVMNLQFTRVRSFACEDRLRNLLADCSTVGFDCVTITWQQIFKGSLHVTIVGSVATSDVLTSDLMF